MKKTILGLVIVFSLLLISGVMGRVVVDKLFNNNTSSSGALANLEYTEQAFVNSCIEGAMSVLGNDESQRGYMQVYCKCVYDNVKQTYGQVKNDFLLDSNNQTTPAVNNIINKCLEQL